MSTSDAIELAQATARISSDLGDLVADDRDAVVEAQMEYQANAIMGRATALLSGDPQLMAIVAQQPATAPATQRPPVLARDLLISVGLVHKALTAIVPKSAPSI